jgi:hypothetical protein
MEEYYCSRLFEDVKLMLLRSKLMPILLAGALFGTSGCTLGMLSQEQMDATVQSMAATQMVVILTSLPSNTPPPTATATDTPLPSPTTAPTLLPTESPSATPLTAVATFLPTATLFGNANPTDFAEDKANKDDLNAPLLLDNQSGEEIHLIILTPVYGDYVFTKNMSLIMPEGTYTYRSWIGEKGPLSGSFSITNGDKHVLIFRTGNINFSRP